MQRYAEVLSGQARPPSLAEQYVAGSAPALKQHLADVEAAFPRYELVANDLIGEGEKVVLRFALRATHQGTFMGIPATGRKVDVPGIIIYRLADHKIVEHWMQFDTRLVRIGRSLPSEGVNKSREFPRSRLSFRENKESPMKFAQMKDGTSMLLRDVREEDAEAIAQLITEFTQLTTTTAQIRRRLARSQGIEHPILAELDSNVVGFASLRLHNYLGEDAPYAEISELFVSARYRRQGIARALMVELEVRARAAGASSLAVLTAADNDPALAVYRAMGFAEFSIALQKWFIEDRPYRESQA